ncbi:hypothetical protein G6F32_015463 [Rhizopus arrhizus]|nr:hypothetical protein G6F32_015463 [Rhizopus arrhizus]
MPMSPANSTWPTRPGSRTASSALNPRAAWAGSTATRCSSTPISAPPHAGVLQQRDLPAWRRRHADQDRRAELGREGPAQAVADPGAARSVDRGWQDLCVRFAAGDPAGRLPGRQA